MSLSHHPISLHNRYGSLINSGSSVHIEQIRYLSMTVEDLSTKLLIQKELSQFFLDLLPESLKEQLLIIQ